MEHKLDQEFGQFNSSKIELSSWIEAVERAPSTADKTEPGAATAATKDAAEVMAAPAEVSA